MSLERKIYESQPKTPEEQRAFKVALKEVESEIERMLDEGEVYVQDVKDEKGNIISYKVFKNNGTLIYFHDVQGLTQAKSRFRKYS